MMNFFNKVLVVGLLVAISQLSASDARAGGSSKTEFGAEEMTAPVARQRSAPATPPACSGGKPGCIDCRTKGKCDQGSLTPDGTCPSNEACIVVSASPACKPLAQTTCNCSGNNKGCDPFAKQPIFCVAKKLYKAKPCTNGQKCSGTGQCVADVPPPGTPDPADACTGGSGNRFSLLKPACTTGVFCVDAEVIDTTECKETEYFDLQSASCKPFPPPNPCGCGKIKCPIIGDCTKYAVCDGKTLLDEESCVGSNNKFDFDNQACATAATGPCEPYETCTFPSSAAARADDSKPTCDATRDGERYPHETESRKYYTCRRTTSSTTFEWVESNCYKDLVFNPDENKCDSPENVPECQK